jgi:hypothetical protein
MVELILAVAEVEVLTTLQITEVVMEDLVL